MTGHKVVWTDQAFSQLEEIFDYYKEAVSVSHAKKMVGSIVDRTIVLPHNPRKGTKEELLKHRKNEYRYLIEGKYKIIYWVDDVKGQIIIAAVFDCRQDPVKIKKIK